MYTLRKDGLYMGYWHDNKDKRHAVYDRDPEKLHKKIQTKEAPKAPTFADIAELWHDKVWDTYREGTRACYASMYQRALDKQRGRNAADVTASDISENLQQLADQKMSARSIKALRTIYRQIYQNAIIDDCYGNYININPALNVPLPRNAKAAIKREAPEDEIIGRIRENAGSAYFGMFAMVLTSTGFRRGEALALQWADVDFKAKTISCTKQVIFRNTAFIGDVKTKAGIRTVPILPDLANVLKRPADAKDKDYIFKSENGTFLSQATFERHWNHYCKDMGFITCVFEEERESTQGHKYIYRKYKNALTPHVLRHGYATMLYDAGVDPYTAQKLLGHADIQTTLAIYTHLSQRKKDESLTKLNAYVENGYTAKPKAEEEITG